MNSPSASSLIPGHPSARYQAVPDCASITQNGYESTVEESLVSYEQEEHELGHLRADVARNSKNSSSIELISHDAGAQDRERPQFTKEPTGFFTILTDGVVMAVPVVLLASTITIFHLDNLKVDEQTLARWRNAITVLATVFPIIFAAIVGRLVCEMARWKLEKGGTMGTLEQLMGSRTVAATLLTQFKLRAINPLGISLLLVWAFSPLGAQSLLRMFGTRLREQARPSAITYYDTHAQSKFVDWGTPTQEQVGLRLLGSWYSALLLAPEASKTDVMDLWGNVKIPFLSREGSEPESETWREVRWNPHLEPYSALAGLHVTNVSAGNTTFSIESSYLSLNCSKVEIQELLDDSEREFLKWNDNDSWSGEWGSVSRKNGTWHGFDWQRKAGESRPTWSLALDRFVDNFWINQDVVNQRYPDTPATPVIFTNEEGIQVGPTELRFQAMLRLLVNRYIITANCGIEQTYVESRVNCSRIDPSSRQNCTVTAQRPSQSAHATKSIMHLSFPQIFRYVSKELPAATGRSWSTNADLSIQYLFNLKPADLAVMPSIDSFEKVDSLGFSRRLAQLLNTYLLLSQMFLTTTYGSIDANAVFSPNKTVEVDVRNPVKVYTVSKPWLALFIISCVVLLLSGALSVIFFHFAVGPEILGYASTVIQDSMFIDLPPKARKMAGLDVTLLVKDERVRFGFTNLMREGKSLLGVGREEETRRI